MSRRCNLRCARAALALHARAMTDRDYNSRVPDLRHAFRYLWAHKSFTAVGVLTLAIGLGANTALYGLLNAALRPLPVPHPEQIVCLAAETKDDNTGGFQYSFSIEEMKDIQQAEPFSTV